MAALGSITELRQEYEKANTALVEEKTAYREQVDEMTEQMEQGHTYDADSPENKDLIRRRAKMNEQRTHLDDVVRDLRFAESVQNLGTDKANEVVEEASQVRAEHDAAAKKLFEEFSAKQKVDFDVLSQEERDKFVKPEGFCIYPEMAWRSDTGDGATVVETEINRRAVERLALYGPCYELFQKFSVDQSDFEVAVGDQTGTKAAEPGAANAMVDETYANFANAEVTYNIDRKVKFTDMELIAWTRWTARSARRTFIPGPGGHMRLLETAMARKVNDLLTNSSADGSSTARTQVVGLATAVSQYKQLANESTVAVGEIVDLHYAVPRPYRTMSEDDMTIVDRDVASEQVGTPMGTRPDTLRWMMGDDGLAALVRSAATQVQNNNLPWFLMLGNGDGDDPTQRISLFGAPVSVNGDFTALPATDSGGSNFGPLAVAFGRFGYMAVREIDMFLQEYGAGSGAATFGTYKMSNVAVTCKAFDCNVLSVGPNAGKTEAIQGLYQKTA